MHRSAAELDSSEMRNAALWDFTPAVHDCGVQEYLCMRFMSLNQGFMLLSAMLFVAPFTFRGSQPYPLRDRAVWTLIVIFRRYLSVERRLSRSKMTLDYIIPIDLSLLNTNTTIGIDQERYLWISLIWH